MFGSIARLLVVAAAVSELHVGLAHAQSAPGTPTAVRRIEIVPATSQAQITVGSGLSIIADIQNKSDVPVFLHRKYFTMTPTTELTPCGVLDD